MDFNAAIRPWREADFPAIQRLSAAEGWTTVTERPDDAFRAWQNSSLTFVAEAVGSVIGFVRAVSDGYVTTYVAEILVTPERRGQGVGSALLDRVQTLNPGTRLDLLSTAGSDAFYTRAGFRSFPGYRRSWGEFEPLRG